MKRLISCITAVAILSMAMAMPRERLQAFAEEKSTLCINEVMASNKDTIRDGDLEDAEFGSKGGAYSDWVEIYNSGDVAVDLKGYTISDDSFTWVFPEGSVPAKGYLLVWASDKDKVTKDGQLHCNFKISASGESLTLKDANGFEIDHIDIPKLADDNSFGRIYDAASECIIFTKSTPGSANSNGTSYVKTPVFSHDAGFYSEPFRLKLSTDETNAKIYYTTDGSDPIPGQGTTCEYTDGIDINELKNTSNNLLKCSTIKAVTVKSGKVSSSIVTRSYFVNSEIKDKYDLPVISLVTDPANFFDPETGIYVEKNVQKKGSEWERPIHVEFFENDGALRFSKYCGVRINGETSRIMIPQQSLRLYADRDYDDSKKIKYNIFPGLTDRVSNKEINSFKRLILRNSGSDWTRTMFRDALVHSLASDINLDTQAYRPCIAFLNGEYWGIYNIRERYDNIYFESHYGVDKDRVALLEFSVNYALTGEIEVDEGTEEDAQAYMNDIVNYLKTKDISLKENYDYLSTKMDIDNYIDYQILNIFCSNNDWPVNNVAIWKYKTEDGLYHPEAPYGQDGRWRWVVKDADYCFAHSGLNYVAFDTLNRVSQKKLGTSEIYSDCYLLGTLLENQEFRMKFINRYADLLNTTLRSDYITDRIDQMKTTIAASIPDHITRWEGITDWNGKVDVLNYFAENRHTYVYAHIKSRFNSFGVDKNYSVKLETNNSQGYIKINSLELKASTPGITSPESWTGVYFKNVPVTIKAIALKGYQFDHWEGITGADSTSDTITLELSEDINLRAVFIASGATTPTPIVTPTPTNSSTPDFIYGDVNGDSRVNSIDFAYLRLYLLGKAGKEDIDTRAADVDDNGKVNSIDFAYIRQYLLRIIRELPVKKDS